MLKFGKQKKKTVVVVYFKVTIICINIQFSIWVNRTMFNRNSLTIAFRLQWFFVVANKEKLNYPIYLLHSQLPIYNSDPPMRRSTYCLFLRFYVFPEAVNVLKKKNCSWRTSAVPRYEFGFCFWKCRKTNKRTKRKILNKIKYYIYQNRHKTATNFSLCNQIAT